MSSLLNSPAVGVKKGDAASEILGAFIDTNPSLELAMTNEARAAKQPKGMGAADAIDPTR
jgi:hypothetical protein